MRPFVLLALVLLAACASRSSRDDGGGDVDAHTDSGGSDLGGSDAGAMDARATDAALPDAGASETGLVDVALPDLGALDLGALDLGALDSGTPDLGTPDLGTVDLGAPDSGAPDSGTAGAPDLGPPAPRYVLGAPGADCDTTCAALGLLCGRPPGSVGLQCGVHTDIATCNDPSNWIYRDNPVTKPMPYCRADWGTSDVCNNNYNVANSFCCHCI